MSSYLEQQAQSVKKVRPVYEYDVPARFANGITSIGVIKLTSQEELMAAKRAHNDSHKLAYELALQSLAEINGQRVSLADGTADTAFKDMDPQVRQLVLQAYADQHVPEEADVRDFRASRRVKVV